MNDLAAEKQQLDERIACLAAYLDSRPPLPRAQLDLLDRQHLHMVAYSTVLGLRSNETFSLDASNSRT